MVTNVGNICEVWTVFDNTLCENHIKMAWAWIENQPKWLPMPRSRK